MNNNPTRFALHVMYSSFINKWGPEYAPNYKNVESDWLELTSDLSDKQVRKITGLIVEEMTGFPGTAHIKKYVYAVKNDIEVELSVEEKMAMEIIRYACNQFPDQKNKYTISDALEIAASIFYVNDHSSLGSDQKVNNEIHIMPRKSMFLEEASKWVADSYENKGRWVDAINKIKDTYGA